MIRSEVSTRVISPLEFTVQEEEELIGNDRPAYGETRLVEREVWVSNDIRSPNFVSEKIFIANKAIEGSFELVCAAFCYSVDTRSCETTFADIERSNRYLDLLNCFERNRLSVC